MSTAHDPAPALAPLLLVTAALCLLGCGSETVQFNVLRAAKVNVQGVAGEGKDATVSMGQWDGPGGAAEDIKQRIRELVVNAEGGVVRFAESGGVVTLEGTVSKHAFADDVTSTQATCSRMVNQKIEQYSCTQYTRNGVARIRVSMNVVDGNGQTLASDSYADEVERSTSATGQQPPGIDWDSVMDQLRGQAAMSLAQMVVPYRVNVAKPWFGCGDADDQCSGGLLQLKEGNLDMAQDIFKQAIEQLTNTGSTDNEAKAGAWWGLALSQEFSGDFAGARASVKEAIKLDPQNPSYASEMQSIAQEEKNQKSLGKQGVEEGE